MPHAHQSSFASSLASHDTYSAYGHYDVYAHSDDGDHSPERAQSLSTPPLTTHYSSPSPRLAGDQKQQSVRKQTSLANVAVPSFSAFRSQTPTLYAHAPIRKPLPKQHSPRINSFSGAPSPRIIEAYHTTRPYSIDNSVAPQSFAIAEDEPRSATHIESALSARNRAASIDSQYSQTDSKQSSRRTSVQIGSIPSVAQPPTHTPTQHISQNSIVSIGSSAYSVQSEEQSLDSVDGRPSMKDPPSMTLQLDTVERTPTNATTISTATQPSRSLQQQRPKSPVSKLGSLFGWKSTSNTHSPSASQSERSLSPLPSPGLRPSNPPKMARLTPPGLDLPRTDAATSTGFFENPETPLLLGTSEQNAHVQELEKELQHISTELANSIRREMELEDELERVRNEIPIVQSEGPGRRGSDYFSDSGASSTRFPISDADAQIEKVESLRRKAELEKAQIKLEMSERLQTELGRRKELEQLVQALEEQLQKKVDQTEQHGDLNDKLEETETSLTNAKRQLNEERSNKENFELLYAAMRDELEAQRNERDNLKDEIVPQLKARLEGLESEVEEKRSLMYEHTRMQQELQQLRMEHAAMKDGRFASIMEESEVVGSPPLGPNSGLSRSGSLVRGGNKRGGSLTRSGSVREGGRGRSGSTSSPMVTTTAGPLNAEGVKEIEDQRDALHKALQLLIKRHDKQRRDHERAIQKLTKAKDRAEAVTPKRTQYHREVAFLKEEVTTLRKRTEDALEQKWEYEKGLSGLKMDLDRAEEETRGLRIIIEGHDITSSVAEGSDTNLKISISSAESERDQARQAADIYRQRAKALQGGQQAQLVTSAARMDELAEQLEQHVQRNLALREKLVSFVARGERDQKDSSAQIEEMQRRIASMEDSVLAAQQHSETTLDNHEAEARRIEESTSPHLQRLRISIPDPKKLSPVSPIFQSKSPKLGGRKLSETSLLEMSRTQMLERKVRDLEALLREAETDMQTVVAKVNGTQIEVNRLQEEKDAALTQMRKVQMLLVQEREKAEALM